MMNNAEKAFWDYPADKLEDKWACYYNNLRSIMSSLGGNDYMIINRRTMMAKDAGRRPELRSIFLLV